MRFHLFALPIIIATSPAIAQPSAPHPEFPSAEEMRLPPEMSDPRTVDRLMDALQVLSKTFLAMPAGEVEAALAGRPATAADRRKTIASETGMTDAQLKQKIDQSRPQMQAAQKALVAAIPAMMKGFAEAQKEIAKAAANMPQPGYPKQ